VSLNSFGFGGTNVHAILEQYVPQDPGPTDSPMEIEHPPPSAGWDGRFVGPLTLSAETQTSLLASIKEFARMIQLDENFDLNRLAWVTQARRNAFKLRASFTGASRHSLLGSLETAIEQAEKIPVGKRVLSTPPDADGFAVLGIFTGQGAQWATMGRELYRSSNAYATAIVRCENALRDLPDAPSWSLSKELIAPESTSRVAEAEISQPLCTAIQIALIDVLASANV
jgi:aspyridone synthetase (hybrid polyketide synthase/nonribosomal peptide synthetase)